MKIKVKIGTLVVNGKMYKQGDVVDLDKNVVEKLDKSDYEVVTEKRVEEKKRILKGLKEKSKE